MSITGKVLVLSALYGREPFTDARASVISAMLARKYKVLCVSDEKIAIKEEAGFSARALEIPGKRPYSLWSRFYLWLLGPFILLRIALGYRPAVIVVFHPHDALLIKPAALLCGARLVMICDHAPWKLEKRKRRIALSRSVRMGFDLLGAFAASRIIVASVTLANELSAKAKPLERRIKVLPYAPQLPEGAHLNGAGTIHGAATIKGTGALPSTDTLQSAGTGESLQAGASFDPQAFLEAERQWREGHPKRKQRYLRSQHLHDKTFVIAVMDEFRVLGSLEPVLRAVSGFEDDRYLVLVHGDGPKRLSLLSLAVSLGVSEQVQFISSSKEFSELAGNADLMLLTSGYRCYPYMLYSMLGSGIPMLGADTPELRELLSYDELLFEPDNVEALVVVLKKARTSKENLARLRLLTLERAKRYVADWEAQAMDLIFQ